MCNHGARWLALFISSISWFPAASQSQTSVLQALAQRAGCGEQPDSDAARCLFRAWYPRYSWVSGLDATVRQEDDAGAKTYGELEPEGIDQVLAHISDLGVPLGVEDIFVDLGSGVGQVALLVFLKTLARLVVGIELVPERHETALIARGHALEALSSLDSEGDSSGHSIDARDRELRFLHGDITDEAMWGHWAEATVAFTCSTMFPRELMSDLRDSFISNLRPGALVFSLKGWQGGLKDLVPLDVLQAKTSWSRSGTTRIYMYMRILKPLVLNDLNSAVAASDSILDDCTRWALSQGHFAAEAVVHRFCYLFKLKKELRSQDNQPRVDTDWVDPEL